MSYRYQATKTFWENFYSLSSAQVVGQGHDRTVEIAQAIRKRVAEMKFENKGALLPPVSASIGVASTPPDSRTPEIEALADERQIKAKKTGKDRVVSED